MSLVSASLAAVILLATSVDLEPALQQALAVLTGGQDVKGSPSRVVPFPFPVGVIVPCLRLGLLHRDQIFRRSFALQYMVYSNIGVSVIG